jgi:hypothetical protein
VILPAACCGVDSPVVHLAAVRKYLLQVFAFFAPLSTLAERKRTPELHTPGARFRAEESMCWVRLQRFAWGSSATRSLRSVQEGRRFPTMRSGRNPRVAPIVYVVAPSTTLGTSSATTHKDSRLLAMGLKLLTSSGSQLAARLLWPIGPDRSYDGLCRSPTRSQGRR